MKIKSISLENFGKYSKVTASFDNNITYLIGPNGSGKSTLGLTGIWAIFKGIATKSSTKDILKGERFRFINDEGVTATGIVIIHDEEKGYDIKITRKIRKNDTELKFESPSGTKLDQKWLDDLFNVFLISPIEFAGLSSKEQAVALGIDTSEYDRNLKAVKEEYTLINRDYRNLGDLAPIIEGEQPIDITSLNNNIADFNDKLNKLIAKQNIFLEEQRVIRSTKEGIEIMEEDIEVATKRLSDKIIELKALEATCIKINPSSIKDIRIDLIQAEKERNDAYEHNNKIVANTGLIEKHEQKNKLTKELQENKKEQEKIENRRMSYIKSFKLPFKNLFINENGELLLDDKPIKEPYFSTGELIRIIPTLVVTNNPKLKYVFIQRFDLLDEENQKKTIDKLVEKGFQIVIEHVGNKEIEGENCILLKDMRIINQEIKDEDIQINEEIL